MKVVITAATTTEWMPAYLAINPLYTSNSKRIKVLFHQSGVGMLATAVSLTKLIADEKPDLMLQIGIAGCFNKKTNLGKTFVIAEEVIADLGVEEENSWKDIFDLKLEKSNYPPFEKRALPNPWINTYNLLSLEAVKAVTVNQITTAKKRIQQITEKYNPYIESMEGAALHYVCRDANIPFLQIRSTSNYIGERDKTKWNMKESINNINACVLLMIEELYKMA